MLRLNKFQIHRVFSTTPVYYNETKLELKSKIPIKNLPRTFNPNYIPEEQSFSSLLRECPLFNLPPLQDNDDAVLVKGKISFNLGSHFMVNYGGKFDVACKYMDVQRHDEETEDGRFKSPTGETLEYKPTKQVLLNRLTNYYVGREVVILLEKHEETDSFMGEYRALSLYRAKGKFTRFHDSHANKRFGEFLVENFLVDEEENKSKNDFLVLNPIEEIDEAAVIVSEESGYNEESKESLSSTATAEVNNDAILQESPLLDDVSGINTEALNEDIIDKAAFQKTRLPENEEIIEKVDESEQPNKERSRKKSEEPKEFLSSTLVTEVNQEAVLQETSPIDDVSSSTTKGLEEHIIEEDKAASQDAASPEASLPENEKNIEKS